MNIAHLCALALVCGAPAAATPLAPGAESPILLFSSPLPGGIAIVHADFSAAVRRGDIDASRLPRIQVFDATSDKPLPVQYVPPQLPNAGTRAGRASLVVRTGSDTSALRLAFDASLPDVRTSAIQDIDLGGVTIHHDARHQAGLPSRITFKDTGRVFEEFNWNDRLQHAKLGGFLLRHDSQPVLQVVSDGPLCTVVRVTATYRRSDGTQPESRPMAVYDWYYFRESQCCFVRATFSQQSDFPWREAHFLELNFPGRDFLQWLGGEPKTGGQLVGDSASHRLTDWAALVHGQDVIAMFKCGRALIHDGRGAYGTYLHAAGDRAWQGWSGTERSCSGWLWIGHTEDPAIAIDRARSHVPIEVTAVVTRSDLRAKIVAAQQAVGQQADDVRAESLWRVAMARQLEAQGQIGQALESLRGRLPDNWHVVAAGDLRLVLARRDDAIEPISLFDTAMNHEHLAAERVPLFHITLRKAGDLSSPERAVDADRGWKDIAVRRDADGVVQLEWKSPLDDQLGGLAVVARIVPDPEQHALRWQLDVKGPQARWSLWRVRFPQIQLAVPGDEPALLFPRGPGEVQTDVWQRPFAFEGTYPSGWMSMQFMAAYDQRAGGGLYWAIHDPLGGTKDLTARSDSIAGTILLASEFPVANMGEEGARFQLSGEAVWQRFTGDWFDAAVIYRNWVRKNSRWYPQLTADGRDDTPLWMRELCVWALSAGAADECVDQVRRFAQNMGVPVGYHWYRWHKIPFDNDYPHYFPTTEGFRKGVADLQQANVHVMPYINGRLWDTHDRGTEDSEFTQRALSAATKDEMGEPYVETYGSKESDGSPVRLAVMCPATPLWQNQIQEIVTRLFDDCGVHGVYIDQIAAAAPKTCMDQTHGHPLGGGHWWNEGYGKMLDQIRTSMPADRMLTTECNAEPFVKWFDGYLTWHWQYDGQVPAFPAVYGGAIQMFGRAYRSGETRDLALRMKSAQQLVFGEQIGWINPSVLDQAENARFLRKVVRLRWNLRRYFYAGEMLRPPTLRGSRARVRADWQWRDTWWVETDALLKGAWRLPHDNKLVAIFANVSDQPIEATWVFDAAENGLDAAQIQLTHITEQGSGDMEQATSRFTRSMKFLPRSVQAIEIACQP